MNKTRGLESDMETFGKFGEELDDEDADAGDKKEDADHLSFEEKRKRE
jgi:hypothetical protein